MPLPTVRAMQLWLHWRRFDQRFGDDCRLQLALSTCGCLQERRDCRFGSGPEIWCTGTKPVAITKPLNFGNPYEEVYWNLVHALQGMGDACIQFETPVTGGNVSFYNQSPNKRAVNPTPTIGMLGIIEDVANIMTLDLKTKAIWFIWLVLVPAILPVQNTWYTNIKSTYLLRLTLNWRRSTGAECGSQTHRKQTHTFRARFKRRRIIYSRAKSAMTRNFGFDITTCSSIRKDACYFGKDEAVWWFPLCDYQRQFWQLLKSEQHSQPFLRKRKRKRHSDQPWKVRQHQRIQRPVRYGYRKVFCVIFGLVYI